MTRYSVRYFDTSRTSFSYYGNLLLCILLVKTNLLNNIYYIFDHMLGESQQTFFTVKDISAREFIEAFAQYLKKNNLIERPAWADFVKTATSNYQSTQEASLLPLMMIGFTTELPHSPARSILDLALELDFSPTSTEDSREEDALQNIMITPAPRSSDGDFNNWRSKNTLRRIRKEMA